MWTRDREDTIAAIATPPGEGGIGIIRVSGPDAFPIAGAVFRSSRGRNILADRGRVFHGHVCNEAGAAVDEVLLHLMRKPHSFTGEDTAEINGHGGTAPLQAVLERVLEAGARLARPGEFTQRAFLNGRIDLVQAEAVIDRIRARTRAGLAAAEAAADGALSKAIGGMRERLAAALAHIEAAVDFPEEDLPELVNTTLRSQIEGVREDMQTLLKTAETGRLFREGAVVAIVGRPNVGKSSLFNALLRDARAIVTARPGTTRDRLEEVIALSGVPVRLVDTAGLRHAEDEAEAIGVSRARESVKQAHLVLLVVDSSEGVTAEDHALMAELAGQNATVVTVMNKTDLAPDAPLPDGPCAAIFRVSALDGTGLETFEAGLGKLLLGDGAPPPGHGLISRTHQRDSLRRAEAAITRLLEHFDASPEFLSIDLRDALNALGEITGETTPDEILERIFSEFCIGK